MSEILLISSNQNIAHALSEQAGMAALGQVVTCASLMAVPQRPEGVGIAIILDMPSSSDDAAFWNALSAKQRSQFPPLFVLGEGKIAGARESFAKPVRLGRLIDRLRFHLNTAPSLQGESIDFGPYRLEVHHRQIVGLRDETVIDLTEKETALLRHMAREDRVWGKQELLEAVWGYAPDVDSRTLETHIYHLRQKLDQPDYPVITNETGGYRLNRD